MICHEPHKTEPKGTFKLAEYDPFNNEVIVWWRKHRHYKELTATLLHEYTHYLQFWPWYSRYAGIHEYAKNPYEIQAEESEEETPLFLQSVSDRNWRKLLRKEPKLARIYRKVNDLVAL